MQTGGQAIEMRDAPDGPNRGGGPGDLGAEELRAVLDHVPVAVVVVAADGRTVYRNGVADRLLADVAGLPETLPLDRARLGESVQVEAVELRRADGVVPVEAWVGPVATAQAGTLPHVAVVLVDVAERRRTERLLAEVHADLVRKAAALERSNAELETFAYVASHDLSEPLRVISGYVELLARRYRGQLDAEADEFIDFAADGCIRMKQLIDDLLSYSRLAWKDPDIGPVDCGDVVTAALLRLHALVGDAGATVTVGALPTVPGDAERLTALFQNLIGNAVKFARPDVPPDVAISADRDGDRQWRFTVADNGIGIDPQFRERAFGMFRRLHPRDAYGGTGIGLALCRKIVERHGGRIWIDGGPGPGTQVRFTLPERHGS